MTYCQHGSVVSTCGDCEENLSQMETFRRDYQCFQHGGRPVNPWLCDASYPITPSGYADACRWERLEEITLDRHRADGDMETDLYRVEIMKEGQA